MHGIEALRLGLTTRVVAELPGVSGVVLLNH